MSDILSQEQSQIYITTRHSNDMTSSPSGEASKPQKRKGTRSVSTLTPSQLARKRANDREAQRAIRARTREHIERLEREIEELKSENSRDETVQELLRRNKALEQELATLRETLALQAGRAYPPTPYEDTLSAPVSGVSSRASSFGQSSAEYSGLSGFSRSYMPTSEPCEPWTPGAGVSYAPSVVSSPTSSAGNATDDYATGYIPTSVPASMVDSRSTIMSPTSMPCLDNLKLGCADTRAEATYPQATASQQGACMPQQPWLLYPTYYPQSPTI